MMRSFSFFFVTFGLLASLVEATHFRYGTISYTVPDSSSPTVAEVTVTTAWRSSFLDGVTLDLGPGQGSAFVSVSSWDILGTVVDANGESYTLVSRTLTHDFGTVGDYVISFSSCCRISTLVNAADENFRVEATVRLGNDTNGPRASLPAIMQMAAGVPNSIDINSFISGKSHIDADPYTCLMHPDIGINPGYAAVPTVNGASFTVTSDCKLEWDLTGYSPSNSPKFAVSMLIRNSLGAEDSLDFIVEVSALAVAPLECPPVGAVSFTAQDGDSIHADFLVGGGAPGSVVSDVTTQLAGPPGATLMSNFPGTNPLPEEFHFHFVVPGGSSGTLQWVLQFQLGSQFCSQGVSILICNDDDGDGVCNEADICAAGDDNIDTDGDGTPDACEDGGSSVKGDPHIARWNQKSFDFHGECDLLMLHSDHVNDNKKLDLHIRTTIRDFYSSIEVAALRVGEEVLEADAKKFYYNGVEMHDDDLPFETSEFTVTGPVYNPAFTHRREYQVVLNDKSYITLVKTKNFVSLSVAGNHEDFGKSYGLLGDFFTGEALGRDGLIMDDWVEYGMEWQVSENEPKLFRELREPQLPNDKCKMPSTSATSRRRLRGDDPVLLEAAHVACRHAGTDFDACVSDVLSTGDLSFAEAF